MRTTMKGTEKEGPQKTEGTKGMLGMEEMEEMAEDKTQEETDDCWDSFEWLRSFYFKSFINCDEYKHSYTGLKL